jgi:ferrous-iron efflux pump FieF
MDHELPAETRQRIKDIVLAHAEVQGLHDLRTRESGSTQFIELHVEIDGAMTVSSAHEVTDAIEAELFAAFPAAEVILHQEPAGLDDARLDHRINRTATTAA